MIRGSIGDRLAHLPASIICLSQVKHLIAIAFLALPIGSYGLSADAEDLQHNHNYASLEITEKDQYLFEFSEKMERQFRRRGLLHNDPELNEYVAGIAAKLFPPPVDAYIEYRVHLLRDPTFNAFALPDGQLYLFTGSLAALENEAQLAGLIAHEINHIAGHHGILGTRSNRKKAIAGIVVSTILSGVGTNAAGLLSAGVNTALLVSVLTYSRNNEEEADRNAVHRLLLLGYDVHQFSRMFSLMANDYEGERIFGSTVWRTHPRLENRAQYIDAMITELHLPTNLTIGESQFNLHTRAVSFLTVRDHIERDFPRTAIAMAQRLQLIYPDEPEIQLLLGDAMKLLGPRSQSAPETEFTNREKKKNIKERGKYTRQERLDRLLKTESGKRNQLINLKSAETAYLKVLDLNPDRSAAHRGLAESYEGLGQLEAAARSYLNFLKLEPDPVDRRKIIQKLSVITQKLRKAKVNNND